MFQSSGMNFSGSKLDPDLFQVFNQRTTDIVQPNFETHRNGTLGSKMTVQRKDLNSFKEGTSLGRLFGHPKSSPVSDIRTKNLGPRVDPVFHTTENETNTVQTVNVLALEISPEIGQAEQYELAIMHKNNESGKIQSLFSEGIFVDCAPQEIITPEIFNYLEMRRQEKLFTDDFETYINESPSDVWDNYYFHGITEIAGNKTTKYNGNPDFYGKRKLTVSSKGPQWILNYFGPNIKAGGSCWAIIKKQPVRNDYILSQSSTSGNSNNNSIKSNLFHSTYQDKVSFRPHQLSFICMPDGGRPPAEATRHIDELNRMRYDGLAIYLGTLFSVPHDHVFKNVDVTSVGPYTHLINHTKKTSTMLPKLIFNTQNGALTI